MIATGRGHTHPAPQAICGTRACVAESWLRILVAMLKSRALYDPDVQRRREAAP